MSSLATVNTQNLSNTTTDQSFTVEIATLDGPGFSNSAKPVENVKKGDIPLFIEQERKEKPIYQVRVKGGKCSKDENPVKLSFLLDVSQSMRQEAGNNQSKIDVAKKCMKTICDKFMVKGDTLSIDTFSNTASTVCEQKEVTKENKKAIGDKIEGIRAMGMTNMSCALIPLIANFNNHAVGINDVTPTLIIFSDGAINQGILQDDLLKTLSKMKVTNVSVYVVGIGEGVDENFLTKLSNVCNGTFFHSEKGDEDSMATIIGTIMGGERGVVARDIVIDIKKTHTEYLNQTLTSIYNGPFQVTNNDNGIVLKLPDLQEEETKSFFFTSDGGNMAYSSKGIDINSGTLVQSQERDIGTVKISDCTEWFNLKMADCIDVLMGAFEKNLEDGKKKAETIVAYIDEFAKKYSVKKESVAEMREKIEKLVNTKSKHQFHNYTSKTMRATSNQLKRARSYNTGSARKMSRRDAFRGDVSGQPY